VIVNTHTIEDFVGNTPLVRLQRLPGDTSNTILVKLEGNNPAGSVKDGPAVSMIRRTEERSEIRPGNTLIEPTSGNTGIALAMAAAIKGYRLILVMPEHMSVERRVVMKAFGARIVLTSAERSMEGAIDRARQMQGQGEGRVLDQFSNPDNPLPLRGHRARDLARHSGDRDPLHQLYGYYRNDHGHLTFSQGKEPGDPDRRGAA